MPGMPTDDSTASLAPAAVAAPMLLLAMTDAAVNETTALNAACDAGIVERRVMSLIGKVGAPVASVGALKAVVVRARWRRTLVSLARW